jgi:ATP-dependent DNA helicase RecG
VNAESLRKILELESRIGYTDKAVLGGLDKFLSKWSAAVKQSLNSPGLVESFDKLRLAIPDYASSNKKDRSERVSSLLTLLSAPDSPKAGGGEVTPASIPSQPEKPVSRQNAKAKSRVKLPVIVSSVDSPIIVIKGISTNLDAKFRRLGIRTVRDLLYYFPRRHLDFSQRKSISQLTEGKEETIVANVWQARLVNLGGRRSTEAIVGDDTGNIRIIWFNNPYIAKSLATNARIVVSGRVALYRGQHVFESPEWELEDEEQIHTARLVPLYHLTQGLRPRYTRKLIKAVIDRWAEKLTDFLPVQTITQQELLGLPQAISQAHFPDDLVLKDRARVRLAFDELFLLQIGVLSKKRSWQEGQPGNSLTLGPEVITALQQFKNSLPFKLTKAQEKALGEILSDLSKPKPMSRLLQGDVGSGKTVVATAALLVAIANGYQAAFMAPTEILAEQHFRTINQLLGRAGKLVVEENCLCSYSGILDRPVTVALMTGEIDASTRRKVRQRTAAGEIDIVIGTHALIQKDVEFRRLGMAVVDEQHRFGVTQRSALRQKGASPHILVMTATPIPRTLALTLYGDLDLSVIDELPAGRLVIKTKWLQSEQRDKAYAFIRKQVGEGRQAFIICPLVEESESIQAKAAVAEYERLSQDVFPDLRLGLLHGRMSAADKDDVMHRFRAGELDILVATPVVEVGIDVPNATVMMVESADRFGLSQLHQFRGRVGRGEHQSYCMLQAEDPSEVGQRRLDIIEKVYDGFKLAEEDLNLRGPGEFFGTRQSGLPDLRMAKLSDVAILEAARKEATIVFQKDPRLKKPEHSLLAKELARVWPKSAEWS